MLNDDEIVASVQAESNLVDDETDEDDVPFHILHGWHSVFGYLNNHVSERCPVPIDSDKRRSTVLKFSAQFEHCSSETRTHYHSTTIALMDTGSGNKKINSVDIRTLP
ncbi:hypothetical protein TNCV_132381 [Trichonephila clavipes]|nr:hypothetical protein TNCV_132381 [Trichonephila clavipes]